MVRVRLATVEDLGLLVRHRRGMWEDIAQFTKEQLDEADRVYRRWARTRLRSGRLVAFILETPQGNPVASGCLWIMPRQPRPMVGRPVVPYLLSMFTEHEHRGKGFASRIVREAVRWARSRGYDAITLHASDYGESIYRRHGFTQTREMRLRLTRKGRLAWKPRPRSEGSAIRSKPRPRIRRGPWRSSTSSSSARAPPGARRPVTRPSVARGR